MIDEKLLEEYAKLAIRVGVNVQKGQMLLIQGPVEAYDLIRLCTKEAYKAGASKVMIDYRDGDITRMNYEYVDTDVLKEVPEWSKDKMRYIIEHKACMLNISSDDPDLLNGIDSEKISAVRKERMKANKEFQYYTMSNVGQWSIVAYPNLKWAKKVFPDLNDEEAYAKLWEAILYTSRVKANEDVIKAWDDHNKEIKAHSAKLNEYNFRSLHFKNSLGTDLTVGLIKDHVWEGGADRASGYDCMFNPNIPTEEVFTMPDRYRIDGTVVSSKPLAYDGKLIEDFRLTFKDGKVVDFSAKTNEDVLKNMLDTDEGARSLGEVALISHNSPISDLNILFYDTLFDENASCHLALGACYPTNLKGGSELSEEELYAKGGNNSLIHVDFMFGSSDMEIVGETYDDKKVKIFEKGNFII